MHIYLEHPRHGQKVAISELEATYDERNGWRRFTPAPSPPLVENEEAIPEFLNALTPRRRGRPPKNPELTE